MTPTVLFVDPFSQAGHISFNRGYVEGLRRNGFDVKSAAMEGYADAIGVAAKDVALAMPREWFDDEAGRVMARVNLLRVLRAIRRHIKSARYDVVFFAAFEEVSLWLAGMPGAPILVNHANVSGLSNSLKRFFLTRLGKRATFLVFHEYLAERVRSFGIRDVMVEPLGLYEPAMAGPDSRRVLRGIHERLVSPEIRHVLFAPAGSKYGDRFLEAAIADREFLGFLEERGVLLVIKDDSLQSASEHVLVLRQYLTVPEYWALFLVSAAILLQYPPQFDYRVSNILFECFSNGKKCLLSDIHGFRVFEGHFTYPAYYASVADLMHRIEAVLAPAGSAPYRDLDRLRPTFRGLADRVAKRAGA